jgi:UDP-galactopyranose mutase
MVANDVLVVGGGLSGLSFAWKAVQAGHAVTVLERGAQPGGCFQSQRQADGYWFEMGAHTAYNSYGGFIEVAAGTGLVARMIPRGPQRAHFGLLRDGQYRWLTPPRILGELGWFEAALHFPFGVLAGKASKTVRAYYERLLGKRNYARVFAPFFAAVPSQCADDFPATGPGSLFKTRPRRKDMLRSYGFDGGLQTVLDAVAALTGVRVETGVDVRALRRCNGGFEAVAADGRRWQAPMAALAASVDQAARLLGDDWPSTAAEVGRIASVVVDSVGVVLPRARCWLPEIAFLVPVDDVFHSAVTRDPFPDPDRRAFTFHFKPGLTRDQRLGRMADVLRVGIAELGNVVERQLVLPAPRVDHAARLAAIDASLAGERLAVVGNYLEGLAIEDCVQRAFAEWARVSAHAAATAQSRAAMPVKATGLAAATPG